MGGRVSGLYWFLLGAGVQALASMIALSITGPWKRA